jgi:hypothetical protein
LIIRSLGVQVTTKMRFPLACHSRFIPASQIDDVFLYEGFKGMQVLYYLAVVVRGEEKVEVVFPVFKCLSSRLMSRNYCLGARCWSRFGGRLGRFCSRWMMRLS